MPTVENIFKKPHSLYFFYPLLDFKTSEREFRKDILRNNTLRITMATSGSLKRKRKLHRERELTMRSCCKDFLQCNIWKLCLLNYWREKCEDGRQNWGGEGERGKKYKERNWKRDYEMQSGSRSEGKGGGGGGGDKRRESILFGRSLHWIYVGIR